MVLILSWAETCGNNVFNQLLSRLMLSGVNIMGFPKIHSWWNRIVPQLLADYYYTEIIKRSNSVCTHLEQFVQTSVYPLEMLTHTNMGENKLKPFHHTTVFLEAAQCPRVAKCLCLVCFFGSSAEKLHGSYSRGRVRSGQVLIGRLTCSSVTSGKAGASFLSFNLIQCDL